MALQDGRAVAPGIGQMGMCSVDRHRDVPGRHSTARAVMATRWLFVLRHEARIDKPTHLDFSLPDAILQCLNLIVPARPARYETACVLLGRGLAGSGASWQGAWMTGDRSFHCGIRGIGNFAFSSEELVGFKNSPATAYAPRNVWDGENENRYFHS